MLRSTQRPAAPAIIAIVIGIFINRHGAIAPSPNASARSVRALALLPTGDDGKVESALSYLEEVTDAATTAVGRIQRAESTRLRRSLDSLPLGLVLCDESGDVLFRNTQAEALMASRYGDASPPHSRHRRINGGLDQRAPPSAPSRYTDRRGARSPLGVRSLTTGGDRWACSAVIEGHLRSGAVRGHAAGPSSPTSRIELKTPMRRTGLLAETLQLERDPEVAQSITQRINSRRSGSTRFIEDAARPLTHREPRAHPRANRCRSRSSSPTPLNGFRTAAEQHQVTLDFTESANNFVIVGDRRQLVSAVHALLENAVVYSPEGGSVA